MPDSSSSGPGWPSALVSVAIVALVGLMFWKAVDSTNFAEIWAGVGTVVGVITGAIPAYFFRTQVKQANEIAAKAEQKATAIAAEASPDAVEAARKRNPHLF
jgi:hypothetical protein